MTGNLANPLDAQRLKDWSASRPHILTTCDPTLPPTGFQTEGDELRLGDYAFAVAGDYADPSGEMLPGELN